MLGFNGAMIIAPLKHFGSFWDERKSEKKKDSQFNVKLIILHIQEGNLVDFFERKTVLLFSLWFFSHCLFTALVKFDIVEADYLV